MSDNTSLLGAWPTAEEADELGVGRDGVTLDPVFRKIVAQQVAIREAIVRKRCEEAPRPPRRQHRLKQHPPCLNQHPDQNSTWCDLSPGHFGDHQCVFASGRRYTWPQVFA